MKPRYIEYTKTGLLLELKRLQSIIKEVREEIRILETNCDIANYQAQKLFQILDKV